MPTRTKGEKERFEKKIRVEKLLMLLLGLFAAGLFIVLSIVFKKDRIEPDAGEDADPCIVTANALAERFKGTVTQSEKMSIVSFSVAEGKNVSIRVYMKNGIECMHIIRELDKPEPSPTEMFVGTGDEPLPTEASDHKPLSGEIAEYLMFLDGSADRASLASKLNEALDSADTVKASKRTFLFGAYLVTVELSPSDMLLTVTCEP